MKMHWISLAILFALTFGSCSPSQTVVEDSPSPVLKDTNRVSPTGPDATPEKTIGVTSAIATSTATATGKWQTYNNMQAGYSVKYPADWIVNENVRKDAELITMFMAPNNGQGIIVSVLNGKTAIEEIPDMPNTRCQQVTVSGLPGLSCFDTVASSFSTTFLNNGKQYTIATFGKHPDQMIYQSFLESFTVTP
jgi:hypothetical protein